MNEIGAASYAFENILQETFARERKFFWKKSEKNSLWRINHHDAAQQTTC
ncbi:MAG: hypothetical protein ACE37D_08880 [Pseudomonadales bacterium]